MFAVSGGDPTQFWAQGLMKGFHETISKAIPDAKFVTTDANGLNVSHDSGQTYDTYRTFLSASPDVQFIENVDNRSDAHWSSSSGKSTCLFGAMYGLGANSLAVMWILLGIPIYAALPLAIGVGALVGPFSGALVTWLRIPPFIVTLGTYNLLYGVSLWITKTSTFNPVYPPPGSEIPPAQLDFFTGLTASFGAHPISLEVVWMLGLALGIGFLLQRTLFGFRLMAIGATRSPPNSLAFPSPATRFLRLSSAACWQSRESWISLLSRRPSRTSACLTPSRFLRGSSLAVTVFLAARER